MGSCRVVLLLDEDRSYRAGEEIRGRVKIIADGNTDVRELRVRLVWQTGGKANRRRGEVAGQPLFHGSCPAGSERELPFRLAVPAWPRPYRGELVQVGYVVEAIAHASGGDARAEQEIEIAAAADAPRITERRPHVDFSAAHVLTAAIFVGMGSIGLLIGIAEEDALPCAVVFLAIGLLTAIIVLPPWLAERRLGHVRLSLDPGPGPGGYRDAAAPEGTLRCVLSVKPGVEVKAMQAVLQVTESATYGADKTQRTDHTVLYRAEATFEPAGAAGRHVAALALPPPGSVPCSFEITDSTVVWTVSARVEIARWPDWSGSIGLAVLPAGIDPGRVTIRAGY